MVLDNFRALTDSSAKPGFFDIRSRTQGEKNSKVRKLFQKKPALNRSLTVHKNAFWHPFLALMREFTLTRVTLLPVVYCMLLLYQVLNKPGGDRWGSACHVSGVFRFSGCQSCGWCWTLWMSWTLWALRPVVRRLGVAVWVWGKPPVPTEFGAARSRAVLWLAVSFQA